MQTYLTIVKFLSVQDFFRFYEELLSGRVFLPSADPLPDQSKTALKLIIPMVHDSFILYGNVVSRYNEQSVTGMTVEFQDDLQTTITAMNTLLSDMDEYRELMDLIAEQPEDACSPNDKEDEELYGIPMEITEDEIEILEHGVQLETTSLDDAKDSFQSDDVLDDDLMNLKMEYESDDDSAIKVDIAHLPDFDLLEDDLYDTPQTEEDPEDHIEKSSLENEHQNNSLDFNLQSDDPPISDGFIMDGETPGDAAAVSEGTHSGVLFEDLKVMVEQDELEIELEEKPAVTGTKFPEKRDLTPEERAKAEPVGQFFMNLTKAMLRSGYYAPGHPGTDSAKAGLFEEFIKVLDLQPEIMITNHESRDGIDLMITGILDEPVSIRILVGPGVAELFVPKLSEYCDRKQLLSFALKKSISREHFYQFIDIMSDPKVDDHKGEKAGKLLTRTFIEHGITDISTVFVDDMVKLETDLPWRVEMAIHRLAKDLKVMPLFKGVSSEEIKNLKLQTVKDIIRPLKHPTYLNDFLINCYLIAQYVTDMPTEEIEEIVVDAFSINLLLPTSQFTFKELSSLNQLMIEHPDSEILERRLLGIKRILKLIARRVVVEEASGAQNFLESLYRNEILRFNELPADVQFLVNTLKMADDVSENFTRYANSINNVKSPSDALVYLKCFRRTVPVLIDRGDWKTLSRIASVVRKVSVKKPVNTDTVHSGLKIQRSDGVEDFSESHLFQSIDATERPVVYIFKDVKDKIIEVYENTDSGTRDLINNMINVFGAFGVDISSQMLSESSNREVRKLSFEMLVKNKVRAKKWAITNLKDMNQPWYIHRNAMMIIEQVSDDDEDFSYVRNFLEHVNPKIREEALNVAISLKTQDCESIILNAIHDEDPKVRWRAMRSLPEFSPISESTMNELLSIISKSAPKDHEAAEMLISQKVHILIAINGMNHIPISRKVEAEVLELLKSIIDEKGSLWKRVKKAVTSHHEIPMLKAAVPLLGRIGGTRSATLLNKLKRAYPDLSDMVEKSISQMKS